jgi:hypothetical protein
VAYVARFGVSAVGITKIYGGTMTPNKSGWFDGTAALSIKPARISIDIPRLLQDESWPSYLDEIWVLLHPHSAQILGFIEVAKSGDLDQDAVDSSCDIGSIDVWYKYLSRTPSESEVLEFQKVFVHLFQYLDRLDKKYAPPPNCARCNNEPPR